MARKKNRIEVKNNTNSFIKQIGTALNDKKFNENKLKESTFDKAFERGIRNLVNQTQREHWTQGLTGSGKSHTDREERVSIRLEDKTNGPIYKNWVLRKQNVSYTSVDNNGVGTYNTKAWIVENKSNHIKWLTAGTKNDYDITPKKTDGFLWFWYGEPLKWGKNKKPGLRKMASVVHPGHKPNSAFNEYFMAMFGKGIFGNELLVNPESGFRSNMFENATKISFQSTNLNKMITRYGLKRISIARKYLLSKQKR